MIERTRIPLQETRWIYYKNEKYLTEKILNEKALKWLGPFCCHVNDQLVNRQAPNFPRAFFTYLGNLSHSSSPKKLTL